jgi:kynurenine formamidase
LPTQYGLRHLRMEVMSTNRKRWAMKLGCDVPIIEKLADLKRVCGRAAHVYAVPIRIEAACGAPARALAEDLDA